MPKVFVSYSHQDEDWKDKLVTQLGVLEKEGALSIWTDRKIQGGDDWYSEIETAIETAQVAILLISANFLSSDFILDDEIPRLLKKREEGGMRILPLIIKPCAWQEVNWLSRIEVRPKDGTPLSVGSESQIDSNLATFATEVNRVFRTIPKNSDEDSIKYFPPEKIDIIKLPDTNATLYGRDEELELLDNAWENPKTKIISLIAWGGVGKSALTNAWLNNMAEQDYKGSEQVYGWSFYSQGTKEDTQASADGFLNDALQWFGYVGELPKSQFDKGRLLARLIAKKKTLLILDGLEPLQYPPGEMHGHLKDQAMIALLKGLAQTMNGLCIITSRIEVENLKNTEGRMSITHPLENLDEDAGMLLLKKSYGLKGSDDELKNASNEFRGHALALNLLGSYLKTVHDRDIRKRDLIPALLKDERNGGHARRVMESYEKWFEEGNKPELDILYLLGLFDRPASKGAIDVLKAEPTIPGLTDRLAGLSIPKWKTSLQHLRDLRLIAKQEVANENLDCHPLIREHFGEKLENENSDAWQEAHSRLYEYYRNLPEKELPDTLEEMEPLFAAVLHGCFAMKHQEVLDDVYWKRIRRENVAYVNAILGAIGSNLACLSAFFKVHWVEPVSGLTVADKAVVLGWAGFALRAVGRMREAVEPLKVGLKVNIQNKHWVRASVGANNLSELYLILGDLELALKYSKESVDFANQSEDDFQKEVKRGSLANIYFHCGKIEEARVLFEEAENMQKTRQTEYPYLYSFPGFHYCEFLISQRKYEEVVKRVKKTIEWVKSLSSIALDILSIGKAKMLITFQNNSNDYSEATKFLNIAVNRLREAGFQDLIIKGLYTRASLFRFQKEFSNSWTDLDEAKEIAEYGSMKLHLTDYFLEACRVIHAQLDTDKGESTIFEILKHGEKLTLSRSEMQEKFKQFFKEAERLTDECGYHRRDGELEVLREIGKTL